MNKLLLTAATWLLSLSAMAQATNQPATEQSVDTVFNELHFDSQNESFTLESTNAITKEPIVTEIDGESYILRDGKGYKVEDLLTTGSKNVAADRAYKERHDLRRVIVIAICFLFPCGTLIACLVAVLIFFLKKSRTKASIIEKAIDANYPLPDSFFSNQRVPFAESGNFYAPEDHATDSAYFQPKQGPQKWLNLELTDPSIRDPKKFSSGVTLVAIGLAMILFFCAETSATGMLLAGCIPFFIGVGKLIGYFYIPGYTSANLKRQNFPEGHYYHQQRAQTPSQQPEVTRNNHASSCPPPINSNDNN